MTPTVLIIEDEPDMLRLFKAIVSREDYQVTGALRGTTGLVKAQRRKPDVVLLDLKLPGMSGADFLRFIRQSAELKDVKVIIITAYPNLIREVRESGADIVFTKPFRPSELMDTITELLTQSDPP